MQDRACSILNLELQTYSLERLGGGQLYLRQSASRKAPLHRLNPCSVIGSAVNELYAPFSLPRSATLLNGWGSPIFRSVSASTCLLRLSAVRVLLIPCYSCGASSKSLFCCTISVCVGSWIDYPLTTMTKR